MSNEAARLPAALVDLLTVPPSPEPRPVPAANSYKPGDGYGAAALAGEVSRVRAASNGTRNETLFRAAIRMGQLVAAGALDRVTVENELTAAALDVGLGEIEAGKTIQSGLGKGEREPRVIDPKDDGPAIPPDDPYNEPPPGMAYEDLGAPDLAPEPASASEREGAPTDDELRDRVREQYPEIVYGLGEFHAFDGTIYQRLEREIVRQRITEVLEAAKVEGIKPNAHKVASVFEMLRDKVYVAASAWNANTDLLPCVNGVLHIPTRELRPHGPENYFTSMLPYAYDPEAEADTWLWFVMVTIPAAADFLQEFAGYALTGDTRHEIAVWLQGPPGSGKSTFLLGLETMLGSRAGLVSLSDVERSRFALADVPGKTLLVSTEQPSDYISSGAKLNALISGEPLSVERKFRDAVTIVSRAKLAWAMNSLPRVGDSNSGLFRRVKVIKFPHLPEEKRDPALKAAIASEGAGILNWALAGLDRLTAHGRFDVPACVIDATEEFRAGNDIPAQFVGERCVTGPDYRAQSAQLYKAYKDWCFETGHKAQSSTSLATDWQRLGFDRKRIAGKSYWQGVGLADDSLPA